MVRARPLGLAEAFIAAGARTVLQKLWCDEETALSDTVSMFAVEGGLNVRPADTVATYCGTLCSAVLYCIVCMTIHSALQYPRLQVLTRLLARFIRLRCTVSSPRHVFSNIHLLYFTV